MYFFLHTEIDGHSAEYNEREVGVEDGEGKLTEYIDPVKADEITTDRINNEKRLMDCVDCHNRVTHLFKSPEQLIEIVKSFSSETKLHDDLTLICIKKLKKAL